MTLVHSYIQVTARSINYILFVRALGVSMWKQLVKVLQLKYPIISYMNKLYEGNKKTLLTQTLHRKILKLLCKIKKKILTATGYKPRFTRDIIAKLLCDDNSDINI